MFANREANSPRPTNPYMTTSSSNGPRPAAVNQRRRTKPTFVQSLSGLLAASIVISVLLTVQGVAAQQIGDGSDISAVDIDRAVEDVLSGSAYAAQAASGLGFVTDNPVTRYVARTWRGIVEWFNSFFEDEEPSAPTETAVPDSDRSSFAIPLLIGIGLLAASLAALLARRRTKLEEFEFAADPHGELRKEELETEADRAEASGDHELSVRLRFKSGLLALDRRGIITYDEAEPLGMVRRAVNEADFDAVANGFERVTYSEHVAEMADSESARTGWSSLLNRNEQTDDG